MGKVDKWTIAAAMIFIAVILVFIVQRNKATVTTGTIIGVSGFILAYFAWNEGAKIKQNDYKGKVFIKPEHAETAEELTDFDPSREIDGIVTAFNKEKVYKAHNGTYLKILETGEVKVISPLTAIRTPGYVGKDYFTPQQQKQWQPLFEALNKA